MRADGGLMFNGCRELRISKIVSRVSFISFLFCCKNRILTMKEMSQKKYLLTQKMIDINPNYSEKFVNF